jgi:hypothetical protein
VIKDFVTYEATIFTSFLLEGYDWKSLTQDALVVDVGGGVGSSTLQLTKAYPHLRYVVQDRAKVIPDAVTVCLRVNKK